MIGEELSLRFLSQLAWFGQGRLLYPHEKWTPHRQMPLQLPLGCHFRRTLDPGARLRDRKMRKQLEWKRCFCWTYHHQVNIRDEFTRAA